MGGEFRASNDADRNFIPSWWASVDSKGYASCDVKGKVWERLVMRNGTKLCSV
jgi:hypothetical protein